MLNMPRPRLLPVALMALLLAVAAVFWWGVPDLLFGPAAKDGAAGREALSAEVAADGIVVPVLLVDDQDVRGGR